MHVYELIYFVVFGFVAERVDLIPPFYGRIDIDHNKIHAMIRVGQRNASIHVHPTLLLILTQLIIKGLKVKSPPLQIMIQKLDKQTLILQMLSI